MGLVISVETSLKPECLANPEEDAKTNLIIKGRCQTFKLPEDEIEKLVQNGRPSNDAVDLAKGAFDKHVGNEKRIVEGYRDHMKAELDALYPQLQVEKREVEKIKSEGRHKSYDGTVVNIPPHLKFQQAIISTFAWILVAAGVIQLAIFLHNNNGMEWWQAFVLPFSGVVGLSWATKFGLTQLHSDHPAVYKVMKYVVLLAGVGCLVSWVLLYSEYSVTLAQGPQFTTLDGGLPADTGGHGSHLMVALQILGEAFVAAFLFTIASEITAKHTTHDGVRKTKEFLDEENDVAEVKKKIAFAQSRVTHMDGLLAKLEAAKQSTIEQASALWSKYHAKNS